MTTNEPSNDIVERFYIASAEQFNKWVNTHCALPSGQYSHEQLRHLLWLSWSAAIDLVLVMAVDPDTVEDIKRTTGGGK